jgi:hypothetical protein
MRKLALPIPGLALLFIGPSIVAFTGIISLSGYSDKKIVSLLVPDWAKRLFY